jgi:hypothetical protein
MKSKFILLILVLGSLIQIFSGCAAARTTTAESTTTETAKTSVPETTTTSAKTTKASISIDCSLAAKAGLKGAPENGVILKQQIVEIEENETAFEFLKRVCRQEGILLSYKGSGRLLFVTGIAGLSAINAKSGWMFSVNGEFLMVGAGSYIVQENDDIVWHYTMDSGKDLE